ncbi:uncharacterized protein IL334_004843 [Kwoniella shivajii]|uniref:HMG box domain-containing protein n=1 Tax=Kwoniella shivajii TaxID=564305 RepID=A0ABZ1D1H4_9TREE|nr:hypothetical protein IL334_004843 [Kwoniella shivajii]
MAPTEPKKGGAKKPSAYNEYMKVQLAKLKADAEKTGKKSDHKENFKKVAESWKTAPENPVSIIVLCLPFLPLSFERGKSVAINLN